MSYHADCFYCEKCKVPCYGKQFVPQGEPLKRSWKIFCVSCDASGALDNAVYYSDQRPENTRYNEPEKPPPKRDPVYVPVPEEPKEKTKKVVSIYEKQQQEILRKERLLNMENELRQKTKEDQKDSLKQARQIRARQAEIEAQEQQEANRHKAKMIEENNRRQANVRKIEDDYQKRKATQQFNQEPSSIREIPIPLEEEEDDRRTRSPPPIIAPASRIQSSSPPPRGPSLPISRGPPPPSIVRGPPPPIARGPPPPIAQGPPPPPPSQSSDLPVVEPGRNALLSAIRGFSANRLKPTMTNDRSAPIF